MLVLERDTSLRLEGSAIAMWANAFRPLDALGVGDQLRAAHPLLERRVRRVLCMPPAEANRAGGARCRGPAVGCSVAAQLAWRPWRPWLS